LPLTIASDALLFSADDHRQRPWRPDVVTNRFLRLCRKVGVSGVRLHDLRHFVATNLGAAGTPIATISARLGHRDVATTLNVYSHSLPAADRAAASTLGDLLA
jgi:integrase